MTEGQILDIMRQMLLVCLKLAGPILLGSILVGLIIAIFQAATQIHEQTLTFVPKLLVIALMLLFLGSFMFNTIKDFFYMLTDMMVTI